MTVVLPAGKTGMPSSLKKKEYRRFASLSTSVAFAPCLNEETVRKGKNQNRIISGKRLARFLAVCS
jgi:hypothetical protein